MFLLFTLMIRCIPCVALLQNGVQGTLFHHQLPRPASCNKRLPRLLMEQTTERAYVHSVKAYLLCKELGLQKIQHASLTGGESAVERPETSNPH